jgi:phage-related protein
MVTVTFECMPFRYIVDNFVVTSTSNNFQIENTGKKYSRPQYLLTTSAESGQLRVNRTTKPLTFSNVAIGTKIMIDTELMIVYNYDDNTSLLTKTNGLLPFLNIGNNLVQTTGVSQIEILKNERWF